MEHIFSLSKSLSRNHEIKMFFKLWGDMSFGCFNTPIYPLLTHENGV